MSEVDIKNKVTNNKSIALPTDVSDEIIQKLQLDSAIMRFATPIELPGLGTSIPTITGDPEAHWVEETGVKPVSKAGIGLKTMMPYTLSVIVPFSNQFRRSNQALYNAIVKRLPGSLAKKFDATVIGAYPAPGSNFDTFSTCTAQSISTNGIYKALVAADADVAAHDGVSNGIVYSPKMKAEMLLSTDTTGRPMFVPAVSDRDVPVVIGNPTALSKGAFVNGDSSTPDTLGVIGDWTQAMYGVANGIEISISDQATLEIDGEMINLWQRNMFAVRCEIEVGFVADTTVFNKIVRAHQ